jgi:ankyrin repeat protein
VLDELLDQEGLEVDPVNKMEGDTPLHKAVALARTEKKLGLEVVKLLVEAGADPRYYLPPRAPARAPYQEKRS